MNHSENQTARLNRIFVPNRRPHYLEAPVETNNTEVPAFSYFAKKQLNNLQIKVTTTPDKSLKTSIVAATNRIDDASAPSHAVKFWERQFWWNGEQATGNSFCQNRSQKGNRVNQKLGYQKSSECEGIILGAEPRN